MPLVYNDTMIPINSQNKSWRNIFNNAEGTLERCGNSCFDPDGSKYGGSVPVYRVIYGIEFRIIPRNIDHVSPCYS